MSACIGSTLYCFCRINEDGLTCCYSCVSKSDMEETRNRWLSKGFAFWIEVYHCIEIQDFDNDQISMF